MSDPRERTGAQIMCEALIRNGIDLMFGIPGGAIMPFYHAMFEYRDRLRHVLCRHEQGAGHAAEGYARVTGRVGVCLGTSGPGATNLVTPIADAFMDSTPLLAITGQVSSTLIGTNAFQETDIIGITLPITKHNYLVRRVADIAPVMCEAIYLATSGRPGPVLVDITKDCQQARTIPEWPESVELPGYRLPPAPSMETLENALALLVNAARPLIMAGNGVIQSGATAALQEFAEAAQIPVLTTLHGLGALPSGHPLALGMAGMHGWVHVNRAIQECDVLLAVGCRFDERVTGKTAGFAPRAKIIHIDIDPSEVGKLIRVDVPVLGDARKALELLTEMLCIATSGTAGNPASRLTFRREDRLRWLEHIRALQGKHQHRQAYLRRSDTSQLMPHDVYAALNRTLPARGRYRVVTDVGQHQMWAAQLIDWQYPRTHITSGGAGTMGFALPAALGVALAYPADTVWVVCGDGGFQMTNHELATMQQEGVRNVKIAVINNGYLGMVRQWQQLFEGKRYSGTPLTGPDFARLAGAYGIRGIAVHSVEDVQRAIDAAYERDGVVLIDFRVEREVNVYPMVAPGCSIGEMLTHSAGAITE